MPGYRLPCPHTPSWCIRAINNKGRGSSGLVWLRIRTSDGLEKTQEIASLAEELSASQEGLRSMELIGWLASLP